MNKIINTVLPALKEEYIFCSSSGKGQSCYIDRTRLGYRHNEYASQALHKEYSRQLLGAQLKESELIETNLLLKHSTSTTTTC